MKGANPKWICCQIGAREHYAVARALHFHDALELLITDFWVSPESLLGKLSGSLRARFHPSLEKVAVRAPNLRSITFEASAKMKRLDTWTRMIARNEWFQKMAVSQLSKIESVDPCRTVMAYSYAAREIFKFSRSRGWRTVLGQIDPGPPEERIVAGLYEQDPAYREQFKRPPSRYWSHWREECELADYIVVNSSWAHGALVDEGVPATKIRIIPLAYEEPKASNAFHREYPVAFSHARPLRLLFLGQINLRKGIGPLLDAVRLLRGQPIEFWFVGDVQIAIPSDLRNDPQVRWIGPVAQEQAAQFYRDADLFVFPTFSDGFGLTQLEAQAWKLPIVTTKYCGEVVEDGKNGWLLSQVTPSEIANAIQLSCANPLNLQKLSTNSRVAERFDLAFVGKQWLDISVQ